LLSLKYLEIQPWTIHTGSPTRPAEEVPFVDLIFFGDVDLHEGTNDRLHVSHLLAELAE